MTLRCKVGDLEQSVIITLDCTTLTLIDSMRFGQLKSLNEIMALQQ